MSKKKGLGKLFAGVAIGTGLGMLFAPKKGEDLRKSLKNKIDEMIDKLKGIDSEEVKQTMEQKINEIKEELDDLDKEKILKIAQEKANIIIDKTEKLVEYAIDKGTPVLEKAADSVRNKAIAVTKDVLERLESEDKKNKKNKK